MRDALEIGCTREQALSPQQTIVAREYERVHGGRMGPLLPGLIQDEVCNLRGIDPDVPNGLRDQLSRRYCSATAVASGTVTAQRAYLTPERTLVFTEYDFLVDEVLKADSRISTGETILVVRPGGVVCTAAGRVAYERTMQGRLAVDERHLLFLRYSPEADRYLTSEGDFRLQGAHSRALDGQRADVNGDELLRMLRSEMDACGP